MKNPYDKAILEMIKKMQDASRAINPLLKIEKTMGVAYNKQIIEIATMMKNTFLASNSVLDIGKTMGIAYNNQIIEIAKKKQDTLRASKYLLEIEKTMGVAYNNKMNKIAINMQNTFRKRNNFMKTEETLALSIFSKIYKEHMSLANIVGNISPILEFYKKTPVDKIFIRKDQSIVCGPEIINIHSIQDIVQDILARSSIQSDYINNILIEIRKLQQPFIEKIVVWVIIPLLISLLTTFITPAIKDSYNYYSYNNKQIIKHIKYEINKTNIDLNSLRIFRIVSIDELNVRAKNRTASKLIGKVYFGQIVKVVDKKKN